MGAERHVKRRAPCHHHVTNFTRAPKRRQRVFGEGARTTRDAIQRTGTRFPWRREAFYSRSRLARFISRSRGRSVEESKATHFLAFSRPATSGGGVVPRCRPTAAVCSCAPRASPATSCRAAGRESSYCAWTIASSSPSRQRFAWGSNPPRRRAPESDLAREIRHQQADVASLGIMKIAPRRTATSRRARPRWRRSPRVGGGSSLRSGSPLSGANRKTFGPSEPYRF